MLWFFAILIITIMLYIGLLDFPTFRSHSFLTKFLIIAIASIMTFASIFAFARFTVTDLPSVSLLTSVDAGSKRLMILRQSTMGVTGIVVYECEFYVTCHESFYDWINEWDDTEDVEFLNRLSMANEIGTVWRNEGPAVAITADDEVIRCYHLDGEICSWD